MTRDRFSDTALVLTRQDLDDLPFTVGPQGVRTHFDFAVAVDAWKASFIASGAHSAALYFTDIFDAASALFGCWCAGVRAVLPADTTQAVCERLADGIADICAGDFPEYARLPRIVPKSTDQPCRDALDADLPLVALFTSGSTGQPVLVQKRLSQLFYEVESIERSGHGAVGGVDQDSVIFSTVSAQHIYGLLFSLLWPLSSGRCVWHTRILYPEELIGHISRISSALWVASPAHLKRLPEHLDWKSIGKRLHLIYSSGGPLSDAALLRTIALTGLSPVELLGSSESGGIAWRQRTVSGDGRIENDAFTALPGIEWREENSLLAIRSRQLSSGDWEITNDRIATEADGKHFRLLGRSDRIVKIEAKRVCLTTMEQALNNTSLVQAARLFVPTNSRGRICAVCVVTPEAVELIRHEGKAKLTRRLREVLLHHVEQICLPRYWRYTWEFPENSMGKTTEALLESLFAPGALQAVRVFANNNSAQYIVTVPAEEPTFDGHFDDFAILPGLTQLTMIEKLAQRTFGLSGFAGLRKIKFMQPIRPDDTVIVDLEKTDEGVRFAFSTHKGVPCSRGTILLSGMQPKGLQ